MRRLVRRRPASENDDAARSESVSVAAIAAKPDTPGTVRSAGVVPRKAEIMDRLNQLLRAAIVAAWSTKGMPEVFKGLVIEDWLVEMLAEQGMSRDEYALQEWGCGDSSSRLCMLLVGDEMNDDVKRCVDLADDKAVGAMYKEMLKTAGYLLVRLNVYTKGVSHAFIWLSKARKNASSPLEGYIYQTNIGIQSAHNFDLINWVNDEKSSEVVFLPGYVAELQAQFTGMRADPKDAPSVPIQSARVYEQNFSLTDKSISDAQSEEIDKLGQDKIIQTYMSWKPVDQVFAERSLSAFATL